MEIKAKKWLLLWAILFLISMAGWTGLGFAIGYLINKL